MKKGELVSYGAYQAISIGAERLREDFTHEGLGGLFVPQVKIIILKDSPARAPAQPSNVGKQMWVDRKHVKRIVLK